MSDFLDGLNGLSIERKHFVETFEPEKEPQGFQQEQQMQCSLEPQQQQQESGNLFESPIKIVSPKNDFLAPDVRDCFNP